MEIQIHGRQIDLGQALKDHVIEKLTAGVTKYSNNPVAAQVFFSRDGHEFVCDVTVHLSTGLNVKSTGRSDEIYAASDNAVERVEKQLRRYNRRLKDHHKSRKDPIESFDERSFVIEALPDDESNVGEVDFQPVIVAETQVKVQTLSVGEAVLQMELAGQKFLVFRNSDHGGVNLVFGREDGNVGWIDPRRS